MLVGQADCRRQVEGQLEGESKKRDFLMWGTSFGVREKPGAKENPGTNKDDPQLGLLAIVERMTDLAIYCKQIGDFPNCHHRHSIQ